MTCPRCANRLYEDDDYAGRFLTCLNCGYLEPLDRYDSTGTPPSPRQGKGSPRGPRLRGRTRAQRQR